MAVTNSNLQGVLSDAVDKAAQVLARNSGEELLQNSQELADQRVSVDSGTYHSSFVLEDSRFQAKVTNTAPHAGFIERGTQPHDIEATSAKALHLDQPIVIGGRNITHLKRVKHPGTEAQWVLRDALRNTVAQLFGGS